VLLSIDNVRDEMSPVQWLLSFLYGQVNKKESHKIDSFFRYIFECTFLRDFVYHTQHGNFGAIFNIKRPRLASVLCFYHCVECSSRTTCSDHAAAVLWRVLIVGAVADKSTAEYIFVITLNVGSRNYQE
jgi:hypothetical protein